MSETVQRVNVSLPADQVSKIRGLVADGRYPTVSAFVTDAIGEHLSDEDAHEMLVSLLHEIGGEPTEEDSEWAAQALRLAERASRGHASRRGAE